MYGGRTPANPLLPTTSSVGTLHQFFNWLQRGNDLRLHGAT